MAPTEKVLSNMLRDQTGRQAGRQYVHCTMIDLAIPIGSGGGLLALHKMYHSREGRQALEF